MKKLKLKKYQIGKPSSNQLDPVFNNSLWNTPQQTNTPNANWFDKTDPTLNYFGPRKSQINDVYAHADGYTLDPDGKYRKAEVTEDKSKQQYSEFFQALNPFLDLTQMIANGVSDVELAQRERKKLLDARYMTSTYNPNEKGVNNVPVYLERGGQLPKYEVGDPNRPYHPKTNLDGYKGRKPTSDDSLKVYNAQVRQNAYYAKYPEFFQPQSMGIDKNKQNIKAFEAKMNSGNVSEVSLRVARNQIGEFSRNAGKFMESWGYNNIKESTANVAKGLGNSLNAYKKYKQGDAQIEYQDMIPDNINFVAPMALYDKDIKPQGVIYVPKPDKRGFMPADFPGYYPTTFYYDPIAVKPYNSLTPAEKKLRDKLYGNPGMGIPPTGTKSGKTSVQAALQKQEPVLQRIIPTRGKYTTVDASTGRPQVGAPNMQQTSFDNQTKTNYSYTVPTFGKDQQKTIYFPDEQSLRAFAAENKTTSIQSSKSGATATGYLKQFIAGGKAKKQEGGIVNTTGYLHGAKTNQNPVNIIPGGSITTQNMAFPITANGMPLYPNTGDYQFNSNYVVEQPLQYGGVPEVEGVPTNQASAELEQGEVFTTQQGQINKVAESEPRHEQGGSPQPNVDRVLEDTSDKRKDKDSKALRITPTEVKAIFDFKPKNSLSHSKLYEEVTKRDEREYKSFEKSIKKNLEYVENHGGIYAKNALDENLKLIPQFPTKGERFNTIYQHQEAVKQAYNIEPMDNNQNGGLPKHQTGTYGNQPKYRMNGIYPELTGYNRQPKRRDGYYYDEVNGRWYPIPTTAIDPTTALPAATSPVPAFTPLGNTTTTSGLQPSPVPTITATAPQVAAVTNMVTDEQRNYTLPNETKPSTYNASLGWSGGYGNVLGLVNSFGRSPVGFEQLDRVDYQAHLEDVTPVINANTADYNAAVAQLPQNGVGYANAANLQGQKYKFNNQAIQGVGARNAAKQDSVTASVAAANAQIDQGNMQLRDAARTKQLVGQEKQRQQKFEYLSGIFKAIDEKNAFSANANLALQLTPFFDAKGNFNSNRYSLKANYSSEDGGTVKYILDKTTGQQYRTVYGPDGKILSSTKIQADNKAAFQPIKK